MKQKHKHMRENDRVRMEALLKAGLPHVKIYTQLGCSKSTFYRELKRGTVEQLDGDTWEFYTAYSSQLGQKVYDENAAAKGPQLKVGNDHAFIKQVEHLIVERKFSPYAALAEIDRQGLTFKGRVSERTLYNYVDRGDVFMRVTRQSLFMKGQRKRKYDTVKRVRSVKPLLRSIEDRPKEILTREEFGHCEMDTVIGKRTGKNPVVLSIIERKSRATIFRKITGKNQASVVAELNRIEAEQCKRFAQMFKTLTVDNGCEFLDDVGIERSVNGGSRTTAYYCHPYNNCERGSNENANKMIRRFIPKGEDISDYSDEYIQQAQDWINNYPRRKLSGKTPNDVLFAELGIRL